MKLTDIPLENVIGTVVELTCVADGHLEVILGVISNVEEVHRAWNSDSYHVVHVMGANGYQSRWEYSKYSSLIVIEEYKHDNVSNMRR